MARKKAEKEPTVEEIVAKELDELRHGDRCFCPEPTRFFEPGQIVKLGNLKDVTVVESFDGGKFIHVTYTRVDNNYGRPVEYVGLHRVAEWHDLLPLRDKTEWGEVLHERDDYNFNASNRTIDGLLCTYYRSGVDDQQDYQRDYCWTEEQKVALINSIMTNVEIGKFAFIQRDYGCKGPLYEILDGKQRGKAIRDFYEDRFRWNGKLFSELHPYDRNHFENYSIAWVQTTKLTQAQKYRYFLKLNIGGVPQSKEHLDKVWELLKAEEAK